MAAPKDKPIKPWLQDDPHDDPDATSPYYAQPDVPVYRLTPVTSATPDQVMAAVQDWWNQLSPSFERVDERLTWQLDGCTFDLHITSNHEPE
jgi:hypothetical protein